MKTPAAFAAALIMMTVFKAQAEGRQAVPEALPSTVPARVAELQKEVAELGKSEIPCSASEVSNLEPLICTDPAKAVCGEQEWSRLSRAMQLEMLQLKLSMSVEAELKKKLGENPEPLLFEFLMKEASKNQKQAKGGIAPADGQQDSASNSSDLMALIYEETEKQTFELLKGKGWSKEAVAKLVDRVKAIELSKVRPGDGVDTQKLKTLSEAPWLTSEELKRLSERDRRGVLRSMLSNCGAEGMAVQAFATYPSAYSDNLDFEAGQREGRPAVFVICPGLLLDAVMDGEGPEKAAYVIGHELGHLIQPSYPVMGTLKIEAPADRRKVEVTEKAYQKAVAEAETACPKLKGCFVRQDFFSQDRYINSCDVDRVIQECDGDAQTFQKKIAAIHAAERARQNVIDRLTSPEGDANRDRALLSCLKRYDLNEMNDGAQQIAAFKRREDSQAQRSLFASFSDWQRSASMQENIDAFEKQWGRKPDAVDLHQGELVADYWGSVALAEVLKGTQDIQLKRKLARANLAVLCGNIDRKKDLDYEEHPISSYRYERILSQPDIHSALGCKSPPLRPWCDR